MKISYNSSDVYNYSNDNNNNDKIKRKKMLALLKRLVKKITGIREQSNCN